MNQKEIKELIDYLVEKDIAEFELERGDMKVRVKRGTMAFPSAVLPSTLTPSQTVVASTPAAPANAVAAAAGGVPKGDEPAGEESLHVVRSPIVGSYYESPSPGAPAFVKVGDEVRVGQVLCIVEAMKLMNEIESDVAGEIVRMMVSNGQPVEYGQPLFGIRLK